MKILVAYDGSKCSDAALDDLARAGLPETGEAVVVSVAEGWLPRAVAFAAGEAVSQPMVSTTPQPETRVLAAHGKKRVEVFLPRWSVHAVPAAGSPAGRILAMADEFAADLIVVGSQGRSAIGRFALGSISQKVVAEARCSVRIGRGRIQVDEAPARIMVGLDGSDGSFAAVKAAAARNWPEGSEIRVVSAANPLAPAAIDRFLIPGSRIVDDVSGSERAWLEARGIEAMKLLEPGAFRPSFEILPGNPKSVLVEAAVRWDADCIFLGPSEVNRIERVVFGSTSAAVAARSSSSVEVVRTP